MTDADLIEGLRKSDPVAQLAFVERYSEKVTEHFFQEFRQLDRGEIEDCVGKVLRKIIISPPELDPTKGSLDSYVYGAVRNEARTAWKRWKQASTIKFPLDEHQAPQERDRAAYTHEDEYPSFPPDPPALRPEFSAEELQATREVLAELRLKPHELEHIRMRAVERLPLERIAEFLGISEKAERVRWFRLGEKVKLAWRRHPVLVALAARVAPEGAIEAVGKNKRR